jgi:hypothetical protein
MEITRDNVRTWLLDYAWMGPRDRDERIVECIMMQPDSVETIDAIADQYAGAQESPGPKAFAEGIQYALSALYEAHCGPHAPCCPYHANSGDTWAGTAPGMDEIDPDKAKADWEAIQRELNHHPNWK